MRDDEAREAGGAPSDATSRARRRARLEANLGTPAAGGADRPGAALAHRYGATDRAGRFRMRHQVVLREHGRRLRRARLLRGLTTSLVGIAAVALGVGVAQRVAAPWAGPAACLAVIGLFLAGRRVVERLAEARGSEAWDWQAGCHRLLGQPARRVQDLDRPPTRR